ncbi:hypothetical protein ACWGH8_18320 [Nonomuraea muscovyensis]|jgi:hypothetical protein|uniref:Uncharacterized protein n=1 Tax=Nonomuraea muscovyensis TaxID=1124761 RepID=A0A7X0F333_9ACTN|nr:hypothetical protein [Nonomuraea muscovyensis]MBB6351590.1 hypothetical protein [Nonomuraea muscovyensis]MDF2711240.1 hypothetical protein [Nonomuraea muscovyensis]
MTVEQPAICPRCQGVTVALHASAYTPARARLIVANGFCRGHGFDAERRTLHEGPAETATSPRHGQGHRAEHTGPERRRDVAPVEHVEV